MSLLPWIVSAWLLGCGLWGVVTSRNLIHLVVCLAVMQSATYVLLLGIGYRAGGIAPIFDANPSNSPTVDPIMQALMLTDVVVEATVVALLLAFVVQAFEKSGSVDPADIVRLKG